MNDLELLDKFCETCLDFIDPFTFREIQNRGLLWVVNVGLPKNELQAKSVIRARLARVLITFGDAEIDQIANEIKRLEVLRDKMNKMNMADVNKIIPILLEMQTISEFVLNYYK